MKPSYNEFIHIQYYLIKMLLEIAGIFHGKTPLAAKRKYICKNLELSVYLIISEITHRAQESIKVF